MVNFLCSLMWPFIECYWITCVYLFSLKKMEGGAKEHSFRQQVK